MSICGRIITSQTLRCCYSTPNTTTTTSRTRTGSTATNSIIQRHSQHGNIIIPTSSSSFSSLAASRDLYNDNGSTSWNWWECAAAVTGATATSLLAIAIGSGVLGSSTAAAATTTTSSSSSSSVLGKGGGGGGGSGGGGPSSPSPAYVPHKQQESVEEEEEEREDGAREHRGRYYTRNEGRYGGPGEGYRIMRAVRFLASQESTPPSSPSSSVLKGGWRDEKTGSAWRSSDSKNDYEVSVRALKGGRLSMEDEYFIANGGRFAAVFDGHGGGGVSSYLRDNLYDIFDRHLQQELGEDQQDHDENKDPATRTRTTNAESINSRINALRSSFAEVEKHVLSNDDLTYQGSTAVAVLLHEDTSNNNKNTKNQNTPPRPRTLLTANVGDSRAILSRNGRAIDLTRDHKPNDEKEKARILSLGETVEWDHYSKVYRVKNLSLSRAIGDRFAKPAVSGEVEIKRFLIEDQHHNYDDQSGDEFILLASDGLWDVMSSQDVVNFVHRRLNASIPKSRLMKLGVAGADDHNEQDVMKRAKLMKRKHMSRFVANEALRRGSGDNICVVMVWLKDLRSHDR